MGKCIEGLYKVISEIVLYYTSRMDFDFYNVDVFNRCENGNDVLMAVPVWDNVHPLLKVIPVEWDYSIPYGLLHSREPSATVRKFLSALQKVL